MKPQADLAVILMNKILETLKDSGADHVEAQCALKAAEAMLPLADLKSRPTKTIQT